MPWESEKSKAIDDVFNKYFNDESATIIALKSTRKDAEKEGPGSLHKLSGDIDPETQLLLFFADFYLEQYRHYDNQRSKLATLMSVAVAGFTLPPFALAPRLAESWFQMSMVFASFFAILYIAWICHVASKKHRFRMKTAYQRFVLVGETLEAKHQGAELDRIRKQGTLRARREMNEDDNKKDLDSAHPIEKHTRGMAWNRLPALLVVYAFVFIGVYLLYVALSDAQWALPLKL